MYNARKTTVRNTKESNVERSDIVEVTVHRSVHSLGDYDQADEEEQRRLSLAISKRNMNTPVPRTSECDSTRSGNDECALTTDKRPAHQ